MALKLYNTRTRKKEIFKPIRVGRVSLYSCGPTVYHYAHIGNLRTYVFSDILRRVLEYNDLAVNQVMNITDVGHLTSDADTGEDKMEKGARRERKTAWEIAELYTTAFKNDMHALNIQEPHLWTKATDHINEQIALVQRLERGGHTYVIPDGVYFNTSTFPHYADFAGLKLEQQKAGARVEVVEGKRNPWDFALWKFSPKGSTRDMEWESPWGKGFPGWHIECSAMSMKYLGDTFDIHTGGVDHINVHHTNEIAQTEAATGKEFVHTWMHGEHLVIGAGEKMAKSGDNFFTLQSLVDRGFHPLDYRYYLLTTHYRKKLMFSWEALTAAKEARANLSERLYALRGATSATLPASLKTSFTSAMTDDLNAPKALGFLWEIMKSKRSDGVKLAAAHEFDKIFAIDPFAHAPLEDTPESIRELARQREDARKNKNWKTSDALRDQIEGLGWTVKDTETGTELKKK